MPLENLSALRPRMGVSASRESGVGFRVRSHRVALRRAQRLRKNGDFQRVRQQRQSVSSRLLILAWSPNLESHLESNIAITRVGFVVSKRISKNATIRNTIKRLLSEAVRSLWHEIPQGYDLVLTARHQVVGTDARTGKRVIVADLSTLKQDIRLLLRRAQLLVPAPVVDDTTKLSEHR